MYLSIVALSLVSSSTRSSSCFVRAVCHCFLSECCCSQSFSLAPSGGSSGC